MRCCWERGDLGSERPFSQPTDIPSSLIRITFPSVPYPSFKLSPFLYHQITSKIWSPRSTLSSPLSLSCPRSACTIPASQVIELSQPQECIPYPHLPFPFPTVTSSFLPRSPSFSLGITPFFLLPDYILILPGSTS